MSSSSQIAVRVPDLPEASKTPLKTLGKAFWNLVNHYGLARKDQAVILGIPENRERLGSLEKKKEIPDQYDVLLRVGTLLGIHKNLRLLFPHDRDVVYKWMKTPRELFGNVSALDFLHERPIESLPRLVAIRRVLDQVRCRGN